jgi:hypothetical protein
MNTIFMLAMPGLIAVCLPFVQAPQPQSLSKEIAPLGFLVGTWAAIGGGAPGQGAGEFAFKVELQGKAIVRTNSADYPATATSPATHHDDLMVISADAGKARADYYDSEGHVIRYAVDVPAPNAAVFLSDASPAAPQYRLKYTLDSSGLLTGTFEVAPPGSGGKFQLYLSWTARKR